MSYVRKTRDEFQVLTNYGYGDGWEISTTEDSRKEALNRLREYRDNMPQYPHRLKKVRVKIETGDILTPFFINFSGK